jgi:hypothetical protein
MPPQSRTIILQRVPKRPADHQPVNPADLARLSPIGFTMSDYGE